VGCALLDVHVRSRRDRRRARAAPAVWYGVRDVLPECTTMVAKVDRVAPTRPLRAGPNLRSKFRGWEKCAKEGSHVGFVADRSHPEIVRRQGKRECFQIAPGG